MARYGSGTPTELIAATPVNSCVYTSCAAPCFRRILEVALCAAYEKIHLQLKIMASAVAAIYITLPKSVAMTYRGRKKLCFNRITLVNETLKFCADL